MQRRFVKLNEAKDLILSNIYRSKLEITQISPQVRLIEAYLTIKNENILIIGKTNRYRVDQLSVRKLEDLLNLLQQFSLIEKYERICGDVFKVSILIKPYAKTAKIITFKKLKEAA